MRKMFKNLIFYSVASSAIGLVAEAAGASLAVTMLAALIGPPSILLAYALLRYAH
jgi:hypothetical protein